LWEFPHSTNESPYLNNLGGNNAGHTHTLDKNGALYDPAGTESCNVQIQKLRIAMLITEIKYQIATTVK
jgi:hypothetical protein